MSLSILDGGYGLYVWPSAPVLCQYIIHSKEIIRNKHVVELGAGTALAGLVAAKCGAASVTLTDHDEYVHVLNNCQATVELNRMTDRMRVKGLPWGYFTDTLMSLKGVDIIIAADCFYDTKDFEPVLVTATYLLESNENAVFWCVYQVRSADRSFEFLFAKWGLICYHVHLDEFVDDVQVVCREACSHPSHELLLLVITKSKN